MVTFNEDENQISRQILKTKLESWKISSSPQRQNRFATTSNCIEKVEKGFKQKSSCLIYEFDEDKITNDNQHMSVEPISSVEFDNLINAVWRPEDNLDEAILLVSTSSIGVFENDHLSIIAEKQRGLNGVATWDPHHASRSIAVASGHHAKCFDTREIKSKESWAIVEGSNVKSLDFNPNKQNQIAIGSEDGNVRFYDVRNTKKSIMKLSSLHSHWVWNVKYNPVHDQLFLTSGGDGRVYLHSITSISSEPFGSLIENEVETKVEDGIIMKLEEHDDAVYR